jgi:hypothetical protein
MRILALLLCLTAAAVATTYTAIVAGGDWSNDVTWGGLGHPVAGDVALLDATSGAVTVDVNSACTTLDLTGYTSTLALGTLALAVSGNVTIGTTVGSVATLTIGISGGTGLTVGGDLLVALRGVITCSGASKISCAGSWDVSAGTFTKSTGTVTFNATASGKTVKSGSNTYYNVTWNGSGGEWTLQDNFTMARTTLFTLGTLNLSGFTYTDAWFQTVTMGSGFTLNIGTGTFSSSGSTSLTIPTGATVTVSTGSLNTIANFTISGTGVFTATGAASLRIAGNVDISSSNFNAGTSTLYQFGVTPTLSSSQSFCNYTVGFGVGSTAVTLNSNLTVLNNFSIVAYGGVTRSFSAGSYTINVGGNWANGDVFTAGTGTVIFNDASKTTTVSGTTAFNILQCLTSSKTIKFTAGTTTTVGVFDFSGTAGNLITLDTDTGAGTFALSDASGTNTVEYCDIHRSAAAGGASWLAYTTDGNVDGGSNSGWNFGTFNAFLLGGD